MKSIIISIVMLCLLSISLEAQTLLPPRIQLISAVADYDRNNAVIGISWIHVSTATHYVVDVGRDSVFQRLQLKNYTDPNGINIRFRNDSLIEFYVAQLYDHTPYFLRVRAVRGQDTSIFSNIISVTSKGQQLQRFLGRVRQPSQNMLVVETENILSGNSTLAFAPYFFVRERNYPLILPFVPHFVPPKSDSSFRIYSGSRPLTQKKDTIRNIRGGSLYYIGLLGSGDYFFPAKDFFNEYIFYPTPTDSLWSVLEKSEDITYYDMPPRFGEIGDSLYYAYRALGSRIVTFADVDSMLHRMIQYDRVPIDSVWIISSTILPVRIPENPLFGGLPPRLYIKLKRKLPSWAALDTRQWGVFSGGRYFIQHNDLDLMMSQVYRRYTINRVISSVQAPLSQVTTEKTNIGLSPQPLSDVGKLSYSVPTSGMVKIEVVDVLGRIRFTISNEFHQQGKYEYTLDAHQLSNGRYFIRYFYQGSTQPLTTTLPFNVLR